MGQCICKDAQPASPSSSERGVGDPAPASSQPARSSRSGRRFGNRSARRTNTTSGSAGSAGVPSNSSGGGLGNVDHGHLLGQTLNLDIRDLILETLSVIRTLVNNDQEPPAAMLKLNLIADRESGWLHIVQSMIDIIPQDNPLGPAVITLFLDESPLPTKETVCKLLFYLNLSASLAQSPTERNPTWHRNCCIVLGCIAEKLAGPNSVATFKPNTLEYLVACLDDINDPSVILFSLIALEKYAQTSENKSLIARRLAETPLSCLRTLETWLDADDFIRRQVGFCAQWALDNMFIQSNRPFSYETVCTTDINVMLNHNDVSEYLKISPNGLEARCDVSSFESVRCTFQVDAGVWFYEALIITPGVMQIGWATKDSKFLNHDGYGIGDDEYSVAYDGCRQLLWHNAASTPHTHPPWKAGDILGSLLDLSKGAVMFYLNGTPLRKAHQLVFQNARSGFFAAASFMSFQQCQFNFGHLPFAYPPSGLEGAYQDFNSHATLTDDQRLILPRHKKMEKLRQSSVPENSCSLCFNSLASVTFKPCDHSGFCTRCSLVLEHCPLCRRPIEERREDGIVPPTAEEVVRLPAKPDIAGSTLGMTPGFHGPGPSISMVTDSARVACNSHGFGSSSGSGHQNVSKFSITSERSTSPSTPPLSMAQSSTYPEMGVNRIGPVDSPRTGSGDIVLTNAAKAKYIIPNLGLQEVPLAESEHIRNCDYKEASLDEISDSCCKDKSHLEDSSLPPMSERSPIPAANDALVSDKINYYNKTAHHVTSSGSNHRHCQKASPTSSSSVQLPPTPAKCSDLSQLSEISQFAFGSTSIGNSNYETRPITIKSPIFIPIAASSNIVNNDNCSNTIDNNILSESIVTAPPSGAFMTQNVTYCNTGTDVDHCDIAQIQLDEGEIRANEADS